MGIDMRYTKGSTATVGAYEGNETTHISAQSDGNCAAAQDGANSGSDRFRVLSAAKSLSCVHTGKPAKL
jgi:hypothetical protein